MNAIEFIKVQMDMSKGWILGMASDMKDAPFTYPTPNKGNHPMWCMGHLVYSEADLLYSLILGDENPLAKWKDIFAAGKEVNPDQSVYPSYDEVMAAFETTRAQVLSYLDTISDADLDKPSKAPAEMKDFFGTIGQVLAIYSVHLGFHGGQIADARRAAGRAAIMA